MKRNCKSRTVHQFKSRAGWKNRHHLKPRSRGGSDRRHNILMLDAYRHEAWHLLFGNNTLDEVIELLKRLRDIKANQY